MRPFRFPRRLPVRAEALAVRLGRCGTGVPPPRLQRIRSRSPVPPLAGTPSAEASGLPGSPWTCVLGLPLRSSRAETRSCPTLPGPKPPLRRLAARRSEDPAFRRTGEGPKSVPASWPRTRRSETLGASRSLPLSLPLKDKPAASAWRRLRQPPGPSLNCLIAWWDKRRLSLRLWLGRLSTVAGRSSRPRPGSCHGFRFAPRALWLWITRITGISERRRFDGVRAGLRRFGRPNRPGKDAEGTACREGAARIKGRSSL